VTGTAFPEVVDLDTSLKAVDKKNLRSPFYRFTAKVEVSTL